MHPSSAYDSLHERDVFFAEGIKQAYIRRNTTAAKAAFEKAAQSDSTYGPAWYELSCLTSTSSPSKSLRYAQRAYLTDSSEKWYLLRLGQAQIGEERYRDAIHSYTRLQTMDAYDPDIYRILSLLYEQEEQPFSAIAVLDSAEIRIGHVEELTRMKFRLLVNTRQYDRATAEAHELIEATPYDATNHLMLADLYARQHKDSLAKQCYDDAFRIDSTDLATLSACADYYNEQHDYRKSLFYVRRMFDNADMELADKLSYYDRIVSDKNFYTDYYLQVNDLASTLALRYPQDSRVVNRYARHLIYSGMLDDALAYYKTHLDDSPTQIGYYNEVIAIENYLDRPDSVAHYLSRAMEIFPYDVGLRLQKGHLLYFAEQYEQAQAIYHETLRTIDCPDSTRSVIWCIIGDTYAQMAEQQEKSDAPKRVASYTRQCLDAYKRAVRYDENNANALNNYAYRLSLLGENLEQALKMSSRANDLERSNPTYLDTQAWVLYRLGLYAEAKRYMQRALSLSQSDSAVLWLHYGDILIALDEKFMAEIYWKKALEGGYEDPDAIVERIQRLRGNQTATPQK